LEGCTSIALADVWWHVETLFWFGDFQKDSPGDKFIFSQLLWVVRKISNVKVVGRS